MAQLVGFLLALASGLLYSERSFAVDGFTVAASGAFIFVSSTTGALWLVGRKKIRERPVKIIAFFAYFWVWVFLQAMAFALIVALV